MVQFTGQITVHVDGRLVDTFDGCKFDAGGWQRTPVSTSRRTGFIKKRVPAQLDIPYSIAAGDSIHDLDIEDAVVQVDLDTGQKYVINNASRGPTAKLADDGKSDTTIFGDPAKELK